MLGHAVSRIMLHGAIDNIQVSCFVFVFYFFPCCSTLRVTETIKVSWVKEGFRMASVLLSCGVNDLGGTLMNESSLPTPRSS